MRELARELRASGYERTERESPFDEDGILWTNSHELVCDVTAGVIRKDAAGEGVDDAVATIGDEAFTRHEYYGSHKTRMMGGYLSAYEWHADGDKQYD